MKKPLFSIITVLVLVASLAACSPAKPTPSAEPSAQASAPAASTPSQKTQEPSITDKYPLITDSNLNEPGVYPIAKETAKLSVGITQNANVTSYAYGENFLTTYMQDKTNIELELELFPAADASTKLELMISSGAKLPDILVGMSITNDVARYKYGEAGAIIALDEYYEQLGSEIRAGAAKVMPGYYEDALKYASSPDGHIYGLIEWDRAINNHYTNRAWFSRSFLEAVGMENPTTQEELVDVLRAFRDSDPNGNGINDEMPLVGSTDYHCNVILWLMKQYIYVGQDDDRFTLIENGKLDYPYDKDEWREGLRFAKSLVDEGLLSTLSFTQDMTQYTAMLTSDPKVVGLGVAFSVASYGDNISDCVGANAIKGPNGAQYATYATQAPSVTFAITKDCKNPAMAFLFGASGYNDEIYCISRRYGEPHVDWDYVTPEDKAVGQYEMAGYPAYIKQLRQIWGVPQTSNWNTNILPKFNIYEVSSGLMSDGNPNSSETIQAENIVRLMPYAPDPSKVFTKNIYTLEEIENMSEIRTNVREYVKEAMVLFATGTMNIETDWDKYLKELDTLKYKQLLETDQRAYDRTQGK